MVRMSNRRYILNLKIHIPIGTSVKVCCSYIGLACLDRSLSGVIPTTDKTVFFFSFSFFPQQLPVTVKVEAPWARVEDYFKSSCTGRLLGFDGP